MSTVYSIVKNHGGYITVKSKLEIGTTFHIYLPASEKSIPARKEAVAEMAIAGKGRVLVMDDEEIIRELLHDELTDIGYEVELTVDGAIAGLSLTGAGIGGVIGPWLGGYIYDISGSYTSAFVLCMMSFILSCIAFWIAALRNTRRVRAEI